MSVDISTFTCDAVPLTAEAFAPYGNVIESQNTGDKAANMNTAKRYDHVGKLENLRTSASSNLAIFRCSPNTSNPFQAKLLERHEFSSQLFSPMNAARYLVIVAEPDQTKENKPPNISTFRAFIASGLQGVNYAAGTWHHPMVALDNVTDFTMLVHEDGTAADCEVVNLEREIAVNLDTAGSAEGRVMFSQ
eukprot:TRINITY_DN12211_c0_g1_i1.p1 TRINITY_DN12211_c0_g1~~TRINITY_DN12211_c0_g1_i1.p1  ORF type:complete len:191 (+),score=36.48 TRINITY_DN12211_c0_g1_i1:44-616(+)